MMLSKHLWPLSQSSHSRTEGKKSLGFFSRLFPGTWGRKGNYLRISWHVIVGEVIKEKQGIWCEISWKAWKFQYWFQCPVELHWSREKGAFLPCLGLMEKKFQFTFLFMPGSFMPGKAILRLSALELLVLKWIRYGKYLTLHLTERPNCSLNCFYHMFCHTMWTICAGHKVFWL